MQEEKLNRKLDILLKTGCLLMESAADTSRTMRTMQRVAAWMGIQSEQLNIYIVYNMVMVNVSNDERSYTKFKRVKHHGINLEVLREVSGLSMKAIQNDCSLDDYEKRLNAISSRKRNYTAWQVAIGGGLACGGFCIQFGSDWLAFVYSAISAIIGLRLRLFLNEKGSNAHVNVGIVAFVTTIIAWCFGLLSQNIPIMASSTPWHPVLSCALFIVPGVPLINFVSDMLSGYVQVGITRAVNTFMILLAMAFGIAFALKVCGMDNFISELSMVPHSEYKDYMLAAAISSVGFSMIFNVPRHLLKVVAVCGIIAVCTRNLVNLGPSNDNMGFDLGLVAGSFVGSAVSSIICCFIVRLFRTPHQCLSIPSVIPMIPGALMYRALFAFINMHGVVGEVTVAMYNAIQASLTILFIALGVAIPNVFFRRMIEPRSMSVFADDVLEKQQKQAVGVPSSC